MFKKHKINRLQVHFSQVIRSLDHDSFSHNMDLIKFGLQHINSPQELEDTVLSLKNEVEQEVPDTFLTYQMDENIVKELKLQLQSSTDYEIEKITADIIEHSLLFIRSLASGSFRIPQKLEKVLLFQMSDITYNIPFDKGNSNELLNHAVQFFTFVTWLQQFEEIGFLTKDLVHLKEKYVGMLQHI